MEASEHCGHTVAIDDLDRDVDRKEDSDKRGPNHYSKQWPGELKRDRQLNDRVELHCYGSGCDESHSHAQERCRGDHDISLVKVDAHALGLCETHGAQHTELPARFVHVLRHGDEQEEECNEQGNARNDGREEIEDLGHSREVVDNLMRVQDHVCLTDEIVAQAVGHVVSLLICNVRVQLDEQFLFWNIIYELIRLNFTLPVFFSVTASFELVLHKLQVLVESDEPLVVEDRHVEPAERIAWHFCDKASRERSVLDFQTLKVYL